MSGEKTYRKTRPNMKREREREKDVKAVRV